MNDIPFPAIAFLQPMGCHDLDYLCEKWDEQRKNKKKCGDDKRARQEFMNEIDALRSKYDHSPHEQWMRTNLDAISEHLHAEIEEKNNE